MRGNAVLHAQFLSREERGTLAENRKTLVSLAKRAKCRERMSRGLAYRMRVDYHGSPVE